MASEVDISNLALSNIAEEANVQSISPPDASVAAEKCAQFYPIARDALLEMHAWSFNTVRAVLATLGTNPSTVWQYAYSLPTGCIKPLAVYAYGASDDTASEDFVVEAQANGEAVLYTNIEQAELKYQIRVTNTSRFTPLFIVALTWLLASYLAGAIIKGKTGAAVVRNAFEQFGIQFNLASNSNANTAQLANAMKDRKPIWLSDR